MLKTKWRASLKRKRTGLREQTRETSTEERKRTVSTRTEEETSAKVAIHLKGDFSTERGKLLSVRSRSQSRSQAKVGGQVEEDDGDKTVEDERKFLYVVINFLT